MNAIAGINPLLEKGITAEKLLKEVEARPALVREVIEGTHSGAARERFLCLKTLSLLSREKPSALYPNFADFVEMLDHTNRIYQWNALDILANLLSVDRDDQFGPAKARYFAKFRDGNLITAAHVVDNAPTIIRYRSALEGDITRLLLQAEQIPLPTGECRNILRGKVIQAFDQYYDRSSAKKAMLDFVSRQLDNSRPATGAKAHNFIKKRSR